MNEILSVDLILMAAFLVGHLAQLAHVPEVTGYLVVGVVIGPAVFDLVSHDNIVTLRGRTGCRKNRRGAHRTARAGGPGSGAAPDRLLPRVLLVACRRTHDSNSFGLSRVRGDRDGNRAGGRGHVRDHWPDTHPACAAGDR